MREQRALEDGFTMIEILLVVFIIGLSSAIVIFNLPERASPLQEAADLVRKDVEELQDRAVLTGIPHAIEKSDTAYQSLVWQSGEWHVANFPVRDFAQNISLRIDLDTRDRDAARRIVFDPSGAPVNGRIVVSSGSERVEVNPSRTIWEAGR